MTNIIKHCQGEKKKRYQGNRQIQKKTIPDYQISVALEHVVKSKIGAIFANEDMLEEKSVRIYEIDLYFSEHYKKNTS